MDSVEHLQALLEDTQESLAAALARVEAFRIREKNLSHQIVQLRQKVTELEQQSKLEHKVRTEEQPAAIAAPAVSAPQASSSICPEFAKETSQPAEQKDSTSYEQFWSSLRGGAAYISPVDDECFINLLSSPSDKDTTPQFLRQYTYDDSRRKRKTSVNLVMSNEYIEVVEVKARIRSEDFIGITSAPADAVRSRRNSSEEPKAPIWRSKFLPELTIGGGDYVDEDTVTEEKSSQTQEGNKNDKGYWQILWRQPDGPPNRIIFEASQQTREALHKHTERWLGGEQQEEEAETVPNSTGEDEENEVQLSVPQHLVGGQEPIPGLSEPSTIMIDQHLSALANVIPSRFRTKDWILSYSTARHGISLSTMYRRMIPNSPTITVIKDSSGYIFGCYTPESWRVAPRFFGTGETFVFQLEPHRVLYPWQVHSSIKNDYFMYGATDYLAVGGQGHFAIYVDGELLQGSSGKCGTFGSPCLSYKEEFKVMSVEVWQISL